MYYPIFVLILTTTIEIMRNLKEVLESVIESYNNRLSINFVDLRDLEKEFTCTDAINNLIDVFNKNEKLNFTHVRDIEILINAK